MKTAEICGSKFLEGRVRSVWASCRSGFARHVSRATLAGVIVVCAVQTHGAAAVYRKQETWVHTMQRCRSAMLGATTRDRATAVSLWFQLKEDFPVEWDWTLQDGGVEFWQWFLGDGPGGKDLAVKVVGELGEAGSSLRAECDRLVGTRTPGEHSAWLAVYERACQQRRKQRLRIVDRMARRIVFTKHRTLRPSFFAYTEGQSDAQQERHFIPGAELCLLEMDDGYGKVTALLADPDGAIRDPAVSWDGKRVMFAWKKSLDHDDYHLYELDLGSRKIKQVTSGKGFADYEPAYLPNGDVIFASTRCVQTVDCWWTEVSNLYRCDPDGRFLRRVSFDQVHALYPQVLDDGRVIYTRWDYNDRGQIFPQPLFQMLPDGTGQSEFYGNNSWFPTTIAHARGVPGSQKVLAILCGHHTAQAGKLALIDPALGRQEASGVQFVAPVRAAEAERIDSYGQEGELWQYPFALNPREYLVTYAPLGWDQPPTRRDDADFGVYWMDQDGHRELLAWDSRLPCSQGVPVTPRQLPPPWPDRVDYKQKAGAYYVQDVHEGPGLAGVARGTIKKLRVVALRYRAAGVGNNGSEGPGGAALVSTPIAVGNGSWDVKVILGDATVHQDGSAFFRVPARTPLYFQALDESGYAVQTMRSWSTLQPGEVYACAGCHESKNTSPSAEPAACSLASRAGPQDLEPFYGPARGFSFVKEVQPILDRHCTRCHRDRAPIYALRENKFGTPFLAKPRSALASGDGSQAELAFSLLGLDTVDTTARRRWNDAYLMLTEAKGNRSEDGAGAFSGNFTGRMVRWVGSQSVPEPLPPYFAGAARSELMSLLRNGHQGVVLSREELDKFAAWIDLLVPYCGDYYEANAWSAEELDKYRRFAAKRRGMEEIEQRNIQQLIEAAGLSQ